MNQFFTSAIAEKMAALQTKDYQYEEAKKATREGFDKVMRAGAIKSTVNFSKY